MPHFTNVDLMTHYGDHQTLHFTYYLRHGRPSFAVFAFTVANYKFDSHKITRRSAASFLNVCLGFSFLLLLNFYNKCKCTMDQELLDAAACVLGRAPGQKATWTKGQRTKGHRQKATGQKATRTKGHWTKGHSSLPLIRHELSPSSILSHQH